MIRKENPFSATYVNVLAKSLSRNFFSLVTLEAIIFWVHCIYYVELCSSYIDCVLCAHGWETPFKAEMEADFDLPTPDSPPVETGEGTTAPASPTETGEGRDNLK